MAPIYSSQFLAEQKKQQQQLNAIASPDNIGINQAFYMTNTMEIFKSKENLDLKSHIEVGKMNNLSSFFEQIAFLTHKNQTTDDLIKRGILYNEGITKIILPHGIAASRNQKENFELLKTTGFISYDTETLGGLSKDGENLFDALIELAYTKSEYGNQSIDKALENTKHYLFGIDQDTYNKLLSEIENSQDFLSTNRGNVIGNRLAIYGHKDTIIKGNQIIQEAKLTGIPTAQQMISGLNRLLYAHQLDQKTLRDGETDSQRFMKEFYKEAQQRVVAAHNSFGFDNLRLGNMGYNMNDLKHLDTLSILRTATQYMSKEELFNTKNRLANKTGLSQENISRLILGEKLDNLTAHTAHVDAAIHSVIVSDPIIEKALARTQSPSTVIEAGKALFYNTASDHYDSSSLSFQHLSDNEMNMSLGFSFKNGQLTKDAFKPGILKKNNLYLYNGSGTLTLNKEQKSAFRNINADFAQDQLYFVQLASAGTQSTANENMMITKVFRSKEDMQSFIDKQVLLGVKKDNGHFALPEGAAGERAKEYLEVYDLNTKTVTQLSLQQKINSILSDKNKDKTSSRVRNLSLLDIERTQELYSFLSNTNGSALTDTVTSIGMNNALNVAIKMQNGEVIDTAFGLGQAAKLIGAIGVKNESEAHTATVDNILSVTPFYFKNKNLVDTVSGFVKQNYANNVPQQRHAYSRIMRQLMDEASTYNTSSNIVISKQEAMDYIEFDRSKIRPAKNNVEYIDSISDLKTKYKRINLSNNSDFHLIDTLLELRHGKKADYLKAQSKLGARDYETQAKSVLNEFARNMGINISSKDYNSAEMFSNSIINELKKRKQDNAFYGIYQTQRDNAIESGEVSIEELLKGKYTAITDAIVKANRNVEKFKTLNDVDTLSLGRKIADTFNQKMEKDYFYRYFSDKDARFTELIYERAHEEMVAFYGKFLGEFQNIPGLEILLDEQNKRLFVKHQNSVIDIGERFLPKLKVYNDMPFLQIGKRQVALRGSLSYKNAKNKDVPEFITNIQDALNKTHYSFFRNRELVQGGLANGAEAMGRFLSLYSQELAKSPDVTKKNMMNRQSHLVVDVREVLGMMGKYAQDGTISISNPDDYDSLVNFMTKNGDKASGYVDLDATSFDYRRIARQQLDQTLYKLFGDSSDKSLEYFIALYGKPHGIEKDIANGSVNVGDFHLANQHVEAGRRLPAFQNNLMLFDRRKAESSFSKVRSSKSPIVRFDSIVTSKRGLELSKNTLSGFRKLDNIYSNQIVTKKAMMNHATFRTVLEDYLTKKSSSMSEETYKFIRDEIAQLSLLEDESYMDAYLHDTIFTQTALKKISVSKDIDTNSHGFKELNDALSYSLTYDENTGKTSFKYGGYKDVNKFDPLFSTKGYLDSEHMEIASYDGRLRKGFHSDLEDIMLSEEDINKLIDGKSYDEAQKTINGLSEYFYIENTKHEPYKKIVVNGVEKSRSKAIIISPGKFDKGLAQDLKELGLGHIVNARMNYNQLVQELGSKGISEDSDIMERIKKERYMISEFVQEAMGNNGIGIIANESHAKHEAISANLNQILLDMQGYYIDQDTSNLSIGEKQRNASKKVIESLKNVRGFQSMHLGSEAQIVFDDLSNSLDRDSNGHIDLEKRRANQIDIKAFKDVVQKLPIFNDQLFINLKRDGQDIPGAIITHAIVGQTTEYDKLSGRMPLEYLEPVAERKRKLEDIRIRELAYEDVKNEITQKELPLAKKEMKSYYLENHEETYNKYVNEARTHSRNLNDNDKIIEKITRQIESMQPVNFDVDYQKKLAALEKEYGIIKDRIKSLTHEVQTKADGQIKNIKKEIFQLNKTYERINRTSSQDKQKKLNEINVLIQSKQDVIEKIREESKIDTKEISMLKRKRDILLQNKITLVKAYTNSEKLKKLEQKLNTRKQKLINQSFSQIKTSSSSEKERIGREIKLISQRYLEKAKGHTYDERTLMNLRNKSYSQKYLDLLTANNKHDLLNQLGFFGITEKTPLLATAIDNIIEQAITATDSIVLDGTNTDEIRKRIKSENVAKGVENVFKNNFEKLGPMSLELAEGRYAFSQFEKAANFNSSKRTYTAKELITEHGFKSIDIKDYVAAHVYDEESLQDDYNIFTNNLLVRVGDRDIAVPYIPHSTYSETIVQKEYEREMVALRDAVLENKDAETVNQLADNVVKRVQQLTSKDGPIVGSFANARSEMSVSAKTSTFWEAKGSKHSLAVQTAMHNGRKISEWIDDDVYLNVAFASEDYFKEMGIGNEFWKQFKEGEMLFNDKSLIVGAGGLTSTQQKHILSTYGIEGLLTRFPVIQEGSTSVGKVYLDTTLQGNQIRVHAADQTSKSGDNDGDTYTFSALRYKQDGKWLTSIQLAQSRYEEKRAVLTDGFNKSLAVDAVGINKFLSTKEAKDLFEQNGQYVKNYFDEITKNKMFDNTLPGEQIINPYMDYGEEELLRNKQTLNELGEKIGLISYSGAQDTEEKINALEISTEEKQRYKDAYAMRMKINQRELTEIAKVTKTAIGEMSLVDLELRAQAETLKKAGQLTEDEFKGAGLIGYALEQEVISSKNVEAVKGIERTRQLKQIMAAGYSGKTVKYNGEDLTASQAMGAFLDKEIKTDYVDKYITNFHSMALAEMENADNNSGLSEEDLLQKHKQIAEEAYQKDRDAVVKTVGFFDSDKMRATSMYFKQFSRYENMTHFYSTGNYQDGVQSDEGYKSVKNIFFNMVDESGKGYKPIDESLIGLVPENPTLALQKSSQEAIFSRQMEAALKDDFYDQIGKGNLSAKSLAVTAIAAASAYMLVGAIGAGSTGSNTNQAEKQAENENQDNDTLSDYGYGGNYEMAPQKSGYVINVNAKTPYKNVQPVAQKINQSIVSSTNANLTMSFNVNELPLRDFQISQLIEQNMY